MWRFVHISDAHLSALRDSRGNNILLRSRMPYLIGCLRKDLAALNPDFILATGDLIAQPSRDATFAARDLLDSLGHPYYPLGGNQDFAHPDARAWFIEAFGAHLPEESTSYSFTHNGIHICALDPWWLWPDGSLCPHRDGDDGEYRWAAPPAQIDWLVEDLNQHQDCPTIIALHYPLVPTPSRMRRPGALDYGHLSNADIVLSVARKNPQVIAVMSGHAHMNFVVHDSGITHVVTAALAEYPAEYRDVRVYDDRLEVESLELSDPSFASSSLVPENDWTAGQAGDRQVSISFGAVRRNVFSEAR